MQLTHAFITFILHIALYLAGQLRSYKGGIALILFSIILCATGPAASPLVPDLFVPGTLLPAALFMLGLGKLPVIRQRFLLLVLGTSGVAWPSPVISLFKMPLQEGKKSVWPCL